MPRTDIDDLARRYLAGESLQDIAKTEGVQDQAVRVRLARHGIAIRSRKQSTDMRAGLDTAEIVRRFKGGESVELIAAAFGVSTTPIRARLREAGVPFRPIKPRNPLLADPSADAEIVAAYVGGESELSIARRTGISRTSIHSRLLRAGVELRDISRANKIRMSRMSQEERLALTEAAHAAVRGKAKSFEFLCEAAKGRQANPPRETPGEARFSGALQGMGFYDYTRQKAIGPYNADFAFTESRVAVEIFGGQWHKHGRHAARYRHRVDYLLNEGWLPVIVWESGVHAVGRKAAEYVLTLHQRRCQGKPCGRQEHVIRGDGYVASVAEINFENGSIVLSDEARNGSWGKDRCTG